MKQWVRMKPWNVYINTNKGLLLFDTVFFIGSMSTQEVKESLINHDGYPSDIKVREA